MVPSMVTGATQVLLGSRVNTEPVGTVSPVVNGVLTPTLPPGWVAVSATASMMVRMIGALLFSVLVSLVAPVVAVKVTETGVVSPVPAAPGVV